MHINKITAIIVLVFLCLVIFILCAFDNAFRYNYGLSDALQRTWSAPYRSTEWAPGYKEEKFAKIRVGMSKKQVLELLGQPFAGTFSKWCSNEAHCNWVYSHQTESWNDYDRRWVIFENGQVATIVHEFYWD